MVVNVDHWIAAINGCRSRSSGAQLHSKAWKREREKHSLLLPSPLPPPAAAAAIPAALRQQSPNGLVTNPCPCPADRDHQIDNPIGDPARKPGFSDCDRRWDCEIVDLTGRLNCYREELYLYGEITTVFYTLFIIMFSLFIKIMKICQ